MSGDNPLSGPVNLDTSSTTLSDGIVRVTGSGALVNGSRIYIRNNNSGSSTFQLDGSAGSISINALVTVTCRNNGVTTLHHLAGSSIFNGNILLEVGGNSHTVQSDSGMIVFTGTNCFIGGLIGARTYYFTGAGDHLLIGPILNSTNGAPIAMAKLDTGGLTLDAINTYGNGTTLGSITRMELNKAAGTNDQLRVTGNLAYGGTLVVTNLDGQLWAGDSFQIINPSIAPSGAFTATNLPALPNGFQWQWTPASGTLRILATVALNPTNITVNLAGNGLELSWPLDHRGWRLETNAVSLADAKAWFTLPDSTMTNQIFLDTNPAKGNVFFWLVFP